MRTHRADRHGALSSVKGVYLNSDVITRKRYVGSAYGVHGLWSRWADYVADGHSGNVELRALLSDVNLNYARKALRFARLQTHPARTSDDDILAREAFWKDVLLTRGAFGLNRN